MTKKQKQNSNEINHYQMFLFSCFFCFIIMLNSNYVNKQRNLIKLNKEKELLFNKLIQKRQLSELTEGSWSTSDEICSRGSKDLINYYKTGDLSEIDLKEGPIKSENKNEGYMQALIKLVRGLVDENEGGDDDGDDNDDEESSDSSSSKFDKKNIIEYGKRILPMLVF